MSTSTKLPLDKKVYISVSFVSDSDIQELNKQYKNKDEPTDVLSFEIGEDMEDGTHHLGDIVVNSDQAKRQAGEYENFFEEEVAALVEHGVLHLLGVHHDGDDH